jgi:cytochrome P450
MSTPSQEMAYEPHIPILRANPRQMGGENTNEKRAACRKPDERSMMMSTTQPPCFLLLAHDPYPYYQRMREQQPVVYDQDRDVWFVFRYEDAERVLTEYETFSSQAWCCEFNNVLYYTFTRMDPPQMQQYRSLVSQAFTPRAVAQLPEQITLLATQLLSRVAEAGQMDVVEDLALPLPLLVMRDLLGLPPEDDARLLPWARSNAQLGDGPFPPEMRSYLLDLISRPQRLRPGVIQSLLEARLEGRPLTEAELLGFCGMLFATANAEMTPFLGNVVQGLLEQPGLAEELRANPDLVPGAIEELLRFYPPIPETSPRGTTRAVELSGQSIAAGQRVVPMIASANRDDTMFVAPDRFDIRRTPNPHLSMSTGPHVCLGTHLARLETQVVLSVLLAHLEDLQLAPGATLVPAGMFGVKHLPITFRWRSGSRLAQAREQPDPQVSAGSQCPLPAHRS